MIKNLQQTAHVTARRFAYCVVLLAALSSCDHSDLPAEYGISSEEYTWAYKKVYELTSSNNGRQPAGTNIAVAKVGKGIALSAPTGEVFWYSSGELFTVNAAARGVANHLEQASDDMCTQAMRILEGTQHHVERMEALGQLLKSQIPQKEPYTYITTPIRRGELVQIVGNEGLFWVKEDSVYVADDAAASSFPELERAPLSQAEIADATKTMGHAVNTEGN